MTDEEIVSETEMVEASEMEAMQAELILARAEIENFKAMEASKAEEERLALVASASELGLKGHDDLSIPVLESLIASWTPKPTPPPSLSRWLRLPPLPPLPPEAPHPPRLPLRLSRTT